MASGESKGVEEFDRRKNISLHHLTIEVDAKEKLNEIFEILKDKILIEFSPELVGSGPRKHMMCYEPGGLE